MRSSRLLAQVALLATLALAACGSSSVGDTSPSVPPTAAVPRPASTAKLSIVSPTNGEVIHGTSVELKVNLKGAKIVPAPASVILKPDEGHLHVILDDQLISMTASTQTIIPNVSPGPHLVRVEFVANDHLPFDPRVLAAVAFRVKA